VRLDRWFRRHYPQLNHTRLEKLLRTGQIRIDGRRAKSSDRLAAGQIVRVPPIDGATAHPAREDAPVSARDASFVRQLVIHEAPDFFVLNKPPGLAVQGGTKTARHLDALLPALAKKGEERPRLVHRLDRDTSGALLIARSLGSAASLSQQFRTKAITKIYWALVEGVPTPKSGRIDLALAKTGRRGDERMTPQEEGEGQRAITAYRVISHIGRQMAWVALVPITGRTHQLRAHMAAIGHPIIGDPKYGNATPQGLPSGLQLHARSLTLAGKGGRPITVTAPLPPHMAQTWRLLGLTEGEADQTLAAN